jgi:hypothetical protein
MMLQRMGLDLDRLGSPFFTPRAMLWNIKTLGFSWWLRCLTQNMRVALVEQFRTFGAASSNTGRAR